MAVVADSGAIYALYDSGDAHYTAVKRALGSERGVILIPAAVLAEIDYLLRTFLGSGAELDFLESILEGAFTVEPPQRTDWVRCRELIRRYRDLDLGLADSMVIATAERLGIHRILTVDQRHFRAVVSAGGKPFVLLPPDRIR